MSRNPGSKNPMKSRMSKNPMKSRMPKNPRMSRNPRNPRWVRQGGKSGSRYPGILWIPPYPSDSLDPRCILRIPTVFRIRKSLPNSHIGNTMGIRTIHRGIQRIPWRIQKIQRIRWRSRESKGYGILENLGNPLRIPGIPWESRESIGNPGNTKSAVFHILTRFTL